MRSIRLSELNVDLRASLRAAPPSTGWLDVLGLTALLDSISVYIGPSPKEREKEERKDR